MNASSLEMLARAMAAPRSRRGALAAGLVGLVGVGATRIGRSGAAQGDATPGASPVASPVATPVASPVAASEEVLGLLQGRVTPGIPAELRRTPTFDACCREQDDACVFTWVYCLFEEPNDPLPLA